MKPVTEEEARAAARRVYGDQPVLIDAHLNRLRKAGLIVAPPAPVPYTARIALLRDSGQVERGELIRLSERAATVGEFRIFSAGKVPTRKGTFLFDDQAATSVLKTFREWGIDRLSIDYEHTATSGGTASGAAPAAGWFEPEVRKGELWAASVEWTPTAAKMIEDREYRFVSPTFLTEPKTNRVIEVLNVALTNLPATKNARPLQETRPS
jgi:hypothetical protein